jgi:phosphoribosylanthranilate isomerase
MTSVTLATHQQRTRVKICGITSPEDAAVAVAAGVDAIGLVFYDKSPRAVTLDQAAQIVSVLPPFVTAVGLFVDADTAQVNTTLAAVKLGLLQFHGDESAAYCQQFARPYLKALRMKDELNLSAALAAHEQATGWLLDSYRPGIPGGTGETFDWSRVPEGLAEKIVLAGGLTPANVAVAINRVRPYAVDVSGGVESAPGRKSADKIAAFMAAVREADQQR